MSPSEQIQYLRDALKAMQDANVMSGQIKLEGLELAVTFGLPPEPVAAPVVAGGWKTDPQDPDDPDPLGIGSLDAPIAFDAVAESEPEL